MNPCDDHDPWLYRPDLARWFNRCEKTISEWERRGWLPPAHVMPNGRQAWPRSAIREYVEAKTRERPPVREGIT
jgi:hypothetical protein